MTPIESVSERRTSADVVFDHLYNEIVSLALFPGAKISEVEIANRYGVSRQPVRDAFSRLGNIGLLQIRPQRATEVRRFSLKAIAAARFIRLSLEVEVVRHCHVHWTSTWKSRFARNIEEQEAAVAGSDKFRFLDLDYRFHSMLCDAGQVPFVAEALRENKTQVDRLCLLSLNAASELNALLADHRSIVRAMDAPSPQQAVDAMRDHLCRLDTTIDEVRRSHEACFDA